MNTQTPHGPLDCCERPDHADHADKHGRRVRCLSCEKEWARQDYDRQLDEAYRRAKVRARRGALLGALLLLALPKCPKAPPTPTGPFGGHPIYPGGPVVCADPWPGP